MSALAKARPQQRNLCAAEPRASVGTDARMRTFSVSAHALIDHMNLTRRNGEQTSRGRLIQVRQPPETTDRTAMQCPPTPGHRVCRMF